MRTSPSLRKGIAMRELLVLSALLAALLQGPVTAQTTMGVVLLHGTEGSPLSPGEFARLGEKIEKAGFLVERPEMCWSRTRIYDRTLLDCLKDVDLAIQRLRERGAASFVVGGIGPGGTAAILYGSLHRDLKGVVAVAPRPDPGLARDRAIVASMARARSLITAGRGDQAEFFDSKHDSTIRVRTTANIYVTFWDMTGPANISDDASKIAIPVLWIATPGDTLQPTREAFDRIPPNTRNQYMEIGTDNLATIDAAADPVIAWLKAL